MNGDENNLFKTRDLPLIALFYYKGKVEVGIKKEEGIVYFLFSDKQWCEKMAKDFETMEIGIIIHAYYEKIVEVKHKIFNFRDI